MDHWLTLAGDLVHLADSLTALAAALTLIGARSRRTENHDDDTDVR
ncbi:hypothetical protein ACWD4N_28145 [Streptomyces sp. NPDC002586]